MKWFGLVIIVVVVLWLINKLGTSNKKEVTSKEENIERDESAEAKEIADNVTTIQQFRSLEKQLENAVNRMSDAGSERAYENASHKHDVLQSAIYLAESKIYQWQYTPSVDLHTPKVILERAYKVYSNKEYETLRNSMSGDKTDWHGIDGYGEEEEPEPYIKPLLRFRIIVESDESREEKIDLINKLVSRNRSLGEEFFDLDNSLKPGDQWFAEILRNDGLPLAYDLYCEGYTTPEKCLEIDPSEFSRRKGIGPKKVEQLKAFQARVRNKSTTA